jgi:antitoxin (DNA-binding transcriptional repressor) of toxin-antitoxin stability system
MAVTERNKTHNLASVAPYAEVMGEVPISEATGHLYEVANESAATGEVIYLTRDGRRPAAIVPWRSLRESRMPTASPQPRQPWLSLVKTSRPKGVWAELGITDDQIGHRSEVYDR